MAATYQFVALLIMDNTTGQADVTSIVEAKIPSQLKDALVQLSSDNLYGLSIVTPDGITQAVMVVLRQLFGRRKALNSWVAFRAWMQRAFPHMEQKERSALISKVWKREPRKDKFAIIAAGWTKVRDLFFKVDAGMFVEMVRPLFGIVAAEDYLTTFGLKFEKDINGEFILQSSFVVDNAAVRAHVRKTSYSEVDVFKYCKNSGYLSDSQAYALVRLAQFFMVATLAGPTVRVQRKKAKRTTSKKKVTITSQANPVATDDEDDEQDGGVANPGHNAPAPGAYVPVQYPKLEFFLGKAVNQPPVNSAVALGNQNFVINDEYPFNTTLSDQNVDESLLFNPYMGEGHNAYNISAYMPY